MKTIIAGSRTIKNYFLITQAVKYSKFKITEVISGTAQGVDKLGERWAEENNLKDYIRRFPAEWNTYGKSAGYIRNEQMAKVADALIVVWDGESKGTKHMIELALKYNLAIFLLLIIDSTKCRKVQLDGSLLEQEVFLIEKYHIKTVDEFNVIFNRI